MVGNRVHRVHEPQVIGDRSLTRLQQQARLIELGAPGLETRVKSENLRGPLGILRLHCGHHVIQGTLDLSAQRYDIVV
jgi:hypothetical protein